MKRLFLFVLLATAIFSCKKSNENWQQAAANPEFLRRTQSQLTESIIHDIFAPPVSSRIYMYSALAAYEALAAGNTNYQSMVGQLKGFKKVAKPEAGKEYCYPVAAVRAYLTIGKNLTFAQEIYVDFEKKLEEDYKATGIPSDVYERSIAFR
jgi:hypothetical protein